MANLRIIVPFQGTQLSLIPGDTITTRAGHATVTRLEEVGQEQVIWADYGSGISQPHTAESLLSPEPPTQPKAADRPRRHSPKGKATGWLEERHGNLKRKSPSTSYYYCWQDGSKAASGKPQRGKQYVPVRKMATVSQMVNDRCSVDDILAYLNTNQTQPLGDDRPGLKPNFEEIPL